MQNRLDTGSSCTDHINTIRILIEQCVEHRSDLSMIFMDFEKAFDSIHRDCICTVLRNRAVPEKIICIIRATYEDAKCRVLHKNKLTGPFDVQSSVRQGCILSPVLFLIVLRDVLRDYPDDICLFAHKIPELPAMVKSLEIVVASASVTINCRKTKTLTLTRNTQVLVQVGGEHVSWQ